MMQSRKFNLLVICDEQEHIFFLNDLLWDIRYISETMHIVKLSSKFEIVFEVTMH